jgi:hypothetical protein
MVKNKKPNLVFLMETKIRNNKKMEKIRSKLGFENMFVMDCVGKNGSLVLFWKKEAEVEIQHFSQRHINAKVCFPLDEPPWKFIGFYEQPDASKRGEAWGLLKYIASLESEPWVCTRDFNEILSMAEKFGGSGQSRGLMEAFQKTLEECALSDLGYKGPKFT